MCVNNTAISNIPSKKWKPFYYYILAITFAFFSSLSGISILQDFGTLISNVFINIFKCISLPIIASSIIVTCVQYNKETLMANIWRRTLTYTFATTIIAASLACVLYLLIQPTTLNIANHVSNETNNIIASNNYFKYITDLFPTNIVTPILENKVISILMLSLVIGIATNSMKNLEARSTITNFFKAIHEILLIITSWIIKIVPIGLYGFLTVTIMQLKNGIAINGLGSYLSIIVLANLIQGLIILPLWLLFNKINPLATMKGMLPALSVAFFSKSSSTLNPKS